MTDKFVSTAKHRSMLATDVTALPCEHEAIPHSRQIGSYPS